MGNFTDRESLPFGPSANNGCLDDTYRQQVQYPRKWEYSRSSCQETSQWRFLYASKQD